MINITYPELVHLYHRAERPMPRQVVEPCTGVWGHTTYQHSPQYNGNKVENDATDFFTVFSKAMERNRS